MSTHHANPTTSFFASSPARGLAALLRASERTAPGFQAWLAWQLFFTPVPGKWVARRRDVPRPWRAERLPFEGGALTLWRRSDAVPEAPRVLLVHGWAGDAQHLRPLADSLAAVGFDPCLLDLPAHGRSDGWQSTLPQFVRALFAVSGARGPWAGVVGHSLGALAVAHAAARGLPTPQLALLALAPPPGRFLRWFTQAMGCGEALAQRLQTRVEHREGVPLAQFDPAWFAPRLRQATLLVHDAGDLVAPIAGSQAVLALQPRAMLHTTEGLGHRRLLSDPAVLRAVLAAFRQGA